SYAEQQGRGRRPIGAEAGKAIMQCLDPDLVPVIASLARNFVVCDHWFSSVPGPTWPNRFFLHAGTANGLLDTPETARPPRSPLRTPFYANTPRARAPQENFSPHARPPPLPPPPPPPPAFSFGEVGGVPRGGARGPPPRPPIHRPAGLRRAGRPPKRPPPAA